MALSERLKINTDGTGINILVDRKIDTLERMESIVRRTLSHSQPRIVLIRKTGYTRPIKSDLVEDMRSLGPQEKEVQIQRLGLELQQAEEIEIRSLKPKNLPLTPEPPLKEPEGSSPVYSSTIDFINSIFE